MCHLILCQRTMNFILLLVQLSNWLLKWKEMVKTHLHCLANVCCLCRWNNSFYWTIVSLPGPHLLCRGQSRTPQSDWYHFWTLWLIFIVYLNNTLIITLTGLIYYWEDVEVSIYKVKKTAFSEIIANFFNNCYTGKNSKIGML